MPSPQFVRNIALAALLAGAAFLAANLYLDAIGHASLAKTSFMLAILSDGVFVVAAVLWGFLSAWARESAPPMQRPTAPMPGGPMPGGKMPGAPMIIKPGAPASAAPPAQKPRPPQP